MPGGAWVSVTRANAVAAVARERTADCRGDDQGCAGVASSEPAQDLTPFLLFEVERGDDEVGTLDGNTGLESVEGAAGRRISGRVGASADPDGAARLPDRGREL